MGYPKDANLYQASRAPSYLHFAPTPTVRPGGYYITPARCEEGAGDGVQPSEEHRLVHAGGEDQQVDAENAVLLRISHEEAPEGAASGELAAGQRAGFEVVNTHTFDDGGERVSSTRIRQALAEQYNLGSREPDIQIYNVNRCVDRSLTLRHTQYNRRPLDGSADEIVKHIARLWGFTVRLESALENDKIELTHECRV